jgi:hypothetical protein
MFFEIPESTHIKEKTLMRVFLFFSFVFLQIEIFVENPDDLEACVFRDHGHGYDILWGFGYSLRFMLGMTSR